MKWIFAKHLATAVFAICMCHNFATAQSKEHKERKKEFYFSWGYNKEWYTKSTIEVKQPSLGNHYKFVSIKAHDHPGWDEGILSKALTIPQYNYRLGLFINKQKGIAVEINFDHTKYIFTDQEATVKGTLEKRQVDTVVNFNKSNGYYYYLNNGANFLLFNIVKRWHLFSAKNEKIKIDLLGKAGIGPVIPHVENSLFNEQSNPGFQFGGWNMGAEAALRATFFNYVYLEYCNKIDYARYSNLKVYKGNAKQAFGTYEMIINFGITFPAGGKEKIEK
jgi:hypothetical protein